MLLAAGVEEIARRVVARVRGLDPHALGFAQALAVLGDGCELRHAAAIAAVEPSADGRALAAGLVRLEVLAADDPPRFIHPVVRDCLEASLESDERDAAHRCRRPAAARRWGPGRTGRRASRRCPSRWAIAGCWRACGRPRRRRCRTARRRRRPTSWAARWPSRRPPAQRVGVLREAARAEASAGRETACAHLEEALRLVDDPRERAEIALEVAEAYAALFRWVDAVDVIERALAELGEADEALAARLEGELVVCGLHDARRASRVAPVLERLAARSTREAAAEALAVAQGMAMVLAGAAGGRDRGRPLEQTLARAGPRGRELGHARGAAVEPGRGRALRRGRGGARADARRGPPLRVSARGLVAAYSTLGLLKLRLGALPEADAAARVALRVLQEGDFAPGLAFAATVLADVAVEAGELDEAQALLDAAPAGRAGRRASARC